MKTTKGAFIFLLLVVMILATRQSALGQSEVARPESFLTVDRAAHGTRVSGTLTVHYESVPPTTRCSLGVVANFFFMRLRKNKDMLPPFSGDLSEQHICLDDTDGQQAAIEEVVRVEVIPELFPETPSAPFALKTVGQFVQGVTEPLFVMIDFVIAVRER